MPQMPTIIVQLVHIQGPLKGQVSEFSQFPVHIGRHPACQIRFGKEMTTISRHHARIVRKGNRFRIIDVSTNGTYINGKRIADVYLRDGDVITFSENGPKASFLTKISAGRSAKDLHLSSTPADSSPPPPPEPSLTVGADQEIQVLSTDAPLAIQFGQTHQSYTILPVTIGNDPSCDFVIADPVLSGRHAQIFFSGKNYYAKDLTGNGMVTINGRPVETQSVLAQGAELSLTDQGPRFRFIGEGRLAEIQDVVQKPLERADVECQSNQMMKTFSKPKKLTKSILKSLFNKGS